MASHLARRASAGFRSWWFTLRRWPSWGMESRTPDSIWLKFWAAWKADYPDIEVDTQMLAGAPPYTVASASADAQLLVVGSPYRGRGMDALDPLSSPRSN